MDTQFCKEDRCVEACLDGFPLIAFSSMKEYDEFRNGRLNPKRMANPIGTDSLTSDTPLSQNDEINGKGTKRRNETSKNISTSSTPSPSLFKRRRRSKNSSGQNIDPIPTSDDGGPLLQPGQGFFQSKSGTPYNPDTESGDSVYSDSTEPHSATLREKLPAEVKRNKKKRKVIKRSHRQTSKSASIKKEPRELIDARLHQQVLTYQHHHQHSHHHTMALPLVVNPLGVNWSPFAIQLNDPLVMASLHTAHQVALHKPLQSAPSGKWNSMHARIARFIYQEQQKQKVKDKTTPTTERSDWPPDGEAIPESSRSRTRKDTKKKKTPLSSRSGSVPSAFASIVSPNLNDGSRSLWDRQFMPNPNFPHFQRFNHL